MKLRSIALLLAATSVVLVGASVRADAPVGQFTNLGDNTVQDNVTGLRWQRFPSDLVNRSESVVYCDGLALAGVRWRVPSALELSSIVDERRRAPALDPVFLVRTATDVYWSSTIVRASPTNYYTVTAQLGYVSGAAVGNRLSVRCVAR